MANQIIAQGYIGDNKIITQGYSLPEPTYRIHITATKSGITITGAR